MWMGDTRSGTRFVGRQDMGLGVRRDLLCSRMIQEDATHMYMVA